MAGPLSPAPLSAPRERRALLLALALVVALHLLALAALSRLLQPPSLLAPVAPPFYTRTIAAQAPPAEAPAPPPRAAKSKPNRPSARIHQARAAPKQRAPPPPDATPGAAPPAEPEAVASAPAEPAADASTPQMAEAPAAEPPAPAASAAAPAFLDRWPADTRLTYRLGGHYRGELHGDAEVLWQREGTRYQAVVRLDVGLLLSSRFTSQGEITEEGLRPEVYEEQVRQRRRGVRLGEDVRLHSGERVPRPEAVQDAASQFVELGQRFATGQARLEPGAQVRVWLARPGGVDEWTYDVVGEETLHLPRLGAVQALHLKPRPLARPRGPITAEIWYAPALQHLPVRIRITQGADTFMDLLVETIEQR